MTQQALSAPAALPGARINPLPALADTRHAVEGSSYVSAWSDWRDAYALPPASARSARDQVEERSLAAAMVGLCMGWFVAGPAGGLCGLIAGAWLGAR